MVKDFVRRSANQIVLSFQSQKLPKTPRPLALCVYLLVDDAQCVEFKTRPGIQARLAGLEVKGGNFSIKKHTTQGCQVLHVSFRRSSKTLHFLSTAVPTFTLLSSCDSEEDGRG